MRIKVTNPNTTAGMTATIAAAARAAAGLGTSKRGDLAYPLPKAYTGALAPVAPAPTGRTRS